MNRFLLLIFLLIVSLSNVKQASAANYTIEKVSFGVYAAIALSEWKAYSNALIIVTDSQVILAGAHFVPEAIKELIAEIAKITPRPLKTILLTHHHRGFSYIDFDFPESMEIITSWQNWQSLKNEYREMKNPVTFFDKGLTLQRGRTTIILNNTDGGHSQGDVVVYLPNDGVLFTSDLVYNDVAGYMGDGRMREWLMTLEMLEDIGAKIVVPGLGKVTDENGIRKFHNLFKEFLTEILFHVEKGESLEITRKRFNLPAYTSQRGAKTFINGNIEWAYNELKKK
jgi:glyoxylase-like metal-dependent hydrolase (beta-lactamase superfamily II)